MALDNVISVEFTGEELRKNSEGLTIIETIMRNKSINLSPDKCQQFGGIANRNQLLANNCKSGRLNT